MKQKQKREAGADLGLILTDFLNERRRRKLLGGSGARPNGKFFSILTSQSLLSWVSESFRQDNLASPSPPHENGSAIVAFIKKKNGLVHYVMHLSIN